jgi:hypothetical protein
MFIEPVPQRTFSLQRSEMFGRGIAERCTPTELTEHIGQDDL